MPDSREPSPGPTLFDPPEVAARSAAAGAPLAVRMRPQDLSELVGQDDLVAPGSPLRRLIEGSGSSSVVLWGPPGTGKTTLAALVSRASGRRFVELSAVTAGVRDVRAAVDVARVSGTPTVLFIDEVHRFNRTQQDALLPAVENGWVTLVAATTENPTFSVVAPLLSRSLVLTLHPLGDDHIAALVQRAAADPRGLGGAVVLEDAAQEALVRYAGGDARRALTYLEAAAPAHLPRPPAGPVPITAADVAGAVQRALVRYDRQGDQHYDVISAFIKSVRGSDADAALHYLARMVEAGEDPRFIARRLVILASEDVGLADPTALPVAVAAMEAAAAIGLPEARLPLAQATLHLALAPKSNAVIRAIDAAQADVRAGRIGQVPAHLRDAHHPGAQRMGHGVGYRYPHDDPSGVLTQQYAPDAVVARAYYEPTGHGSEARLGPLWQRLRAVLRPGPPA